ncbi:MAG: ATPase [Clostridia bacterium]|nr:ATPase [Clostridia bacterium]
MKKVLGIELGSTRIKSVLIDENATVLAQGSHEWENQLVNGYWTYSLEDVWAGLQSSYASLCENYGSPIEELDAIGISAMMHGYLAFDKDDNLLVPFRTWRNTTTAQASEELSKALDFNMPQRWSGSHFYQAVLNKEEHVSSVTFLTTLAGYVHWMLTGERVLSIGDASGMFPIADGDYDRKRLEIYDSLLASHGVNKNLIDLLPRAVMAGEYAGRLTEKGASLLDPSGRLKAGCPLCPPEGDAGTGMVATNAVKARTGNVSAGTSAFAMVVLEKPLSKVNSSIDIVATPTGKPVAMVHANNFTSEINAWTSLFDEVITLAGGSIKRGELFDKLYEISASSDSDVGGLVGYNFLSGEPIVGMETGIPLIARLPSGRLTLANFMQMQLYSALGAMSIGMEVLAEEKVQIDDICGHGGFFKTPFIGANAMSAALGAPITVMKNAGEGGAWGVGVLALYTATRSSSLEGFLDRLFAKAEKETVIASEAERAKLASFMEMYKKGLAVEKRATEAL